MRLVASLFYLLLTTGVALSAETREGWIFTPSVGINKLALETFYDTVYKAPFVGAVEITTDLPEDVEGANQYPKEPFYFKNDLEQRPIDVEAGLVMRRNFGESNDFYIGINAWETRAQAQTVTVTFPMQGEKYNRATYSRTGKLSYTQYFLGLRHYLNKRSAKFTSYVNLGIHEIYDVDYEDKNIFEFISGPPKGFKRVFIFKSQATGLLMMQFGLGGEYRFADRFSIGAEGAYAVHILDGALKGIRVVNDTNEGDRIKNPPNILSPVNPLNEAGALDVDGATYNKVNLRFDGWHLLLKFNIEFY